MHKSSYITFYVLQDMNLFAFSIGIQKLARWKSYEYDESATGPYLLFLSYLELSIFNFKLILNQFLISSENLNYF